MQNLKRARKSKKVKSDFLFLPKKKSHSELNSEWDFFVTLKKYYFFANTALISIEIAERSIFNFPAIVSITTVVSASSETFP